MGAEARGTAAWLAIYDATTRATALAVCCFVRALTMAYTMGRCDARHGRGMAVANPLQTRRKRL
jgi:hypothetical protein